MSEYNKEYVVENVVRERGGPGDIELLVKRTAQSDGPTGTQDLPQDPGQAGKGQVAAYAKQLAGTPMRSSPESGSKIQRADPLASQFQHGHVSLLIADWNSPYVEELAAFWTGLYADQVDASSRAFARLVSGGGQVRSGVAIGSY